MTATIETPKIISVDDHVVEPPDLWTSRLPSKFGDRVPHVVRDTASMHWKDGRLHFERGAPDGQWCDWWMFDGLEMAFSQVFAAVGFDEPDAVPCTYDEIALGGWKQADRLAAMEIDHLDGSVCFPNMFSRFCGQTFLENPDRELGLACVQAYNDFILDEWCGGAGRGKLIPLTLVPLWDVELAVRELQRCADNGTRAIAFSENPYHLGLPTLHSGYWEPLFRACAEADVTLTMHIGSSSKMPTTSPDAPLIVTSTTHFTVTVGSMLDFIFSGVLDRIPDLKLFYAESQAGWMPYVLNQADWMWSRRQGASFGSELPNPPSSYMQGRIYTSIFSDPVALRHRDLIGIDQICIETDYPHSDSTFPSSRSSVEKFCVDADLIAEERYKLIRGNAIQAFSLHRLGIEH